MCEREGSVVGSERGLRAESRGLRIAFGGIEPKQTAAGDSGGNGLGATGYG